MDAAAGEDYRADLLAVVANLAPSIVAVYRPHWSSVVACADYLVVFDDYSPHCFLQAGCPFFQDHADVEEVFVIARTELPDDILMMFYLV